MVILDLRNKLGIEFERLSKLSIESSLDAQDHTLNRSGLEEGEPNSVIGDFSHPPSDNIGSRRTGSRSDRCDSLYAHSAYNENYPEFGLLARELSEYLGRSSRSRMAIPSVPAEVNKHSPWVPVLPKESFYPSPNVPPSVYDNGLSPFSGYTALEPLATEPCSDQSLS